MTMEFQVEPDKRYILLFNCNDDTLDEVRALGYSATKIVLGEWGYVTEESKEYVGDAINDLMEDQEGWEPIAWNKLDRELQIRFMLICADSDTFMEKSRLPSDYGYEEKIQEVWDSWHEEQESIDTDNKQE